MNSGVQSPTVNPTITSNRRSQMCAKTPVQAAPPEGFHYTEEFLAPAEENELLQTISNLNFQPFDFHGYIAKRRIVEYGFEYDFGSRRASATHAIPKFLQDLKNRAAEWAGIHPEQIAECVVTEYPPGAPIGWHRDVPQFEVIIGISLKSACRMRFKPYRGKGTIVSIPLQARSIYRMENAARWEYQHSIPEVKELRYSITFRTLRQRPIPNAARKQTRS